MKSADKLSDFDPGRAEILWNLVHAEIDRIYLADE